MVHGGLETVGIGKTWLKIGFFTVEKHCYRRALNQVSVDIVFDGDDFYEANDGKSTGRDVWVRIWSLSPKKYLLRMRVCTCKVATMVCVFLLNSVLLCSSVSHFIMLRRGYFMQLRTIFVLYNVISGRYRRLDLMCGPFRTEALRSVGGIRCYWLTYWLGFTLQRI